jgi:hypothetical protein
MSETFCPSEFLKPRQQEERKPTEIPAASQSSQVSFNAKREERKAKQGRFAWAKKHGYLGCDPQWHELWVLLIPAFGCSCREDFEGYCKDNPPDFSSPTAYWLWGVQLHNWVNRKLGRAELTIEEAKAIWRREDGLDDEQVTEERC